MTIIQRLKDKLLKRKTYRRYKQFKNCSLPYPFWDLKRDVFEWVNYVKEKQEFDVFTELYEAFARKTFVLTYHYAIKSFSKNNVKKEIPNKVEINHGHNFNEVLQALYDYPEAFTIPDEYKKEYSEQELCFLKRVQNYLLLLGLKDFEYSDEKKKILEKLNKLHDKKKKNVIDKMKRRYLNKKEAKITKKERLARSFNEKEFQYSYYYIMYIDKEENIKAMLNGKKNYRIYPHYSFSKSRIGNQFLVVDKEEKFRASLEFTKEKLIPFKELKEEMVDYKLGGYKSFLDYKKALFDSFTEEAKWYNEEEFTEDSLISYITFEIKEKF